MKIQLYSNCILTERYTEVFRTQALLESYLATLDSPLVQEIDIEDTYTKIVGTLCLDITQFSPDGETVESEIKYKTFNYIKFTDLASNNNRVSYAFVSSFSFANGLLVIDYVQDIWHTYLGTWSLRKSIISNTLWRMKTGYQSYLPFEPLFNGNNYSIEREVTGAIADTDVCIVAKVQLYKLSGGIPDRASFVEGYYVIDYANITGLSQGYITVDNNYGRVIFGTTGENSNLFAGILEYIYQYQNSQQWYPYTNRGFDTANHHSCEISKLYILPRKWITNNLSSNKFNFERVVNNSFMFYQTNDATEVGYINNEHTTNTVGLVLTPVRISNSNFTIYNKTITKNCKNISIGFYTSQFKYEYIGRDHYVTITCSIGLDEFAIYLNYNGAKTEITELFEFTQDYQVITAETVAQREIARKIETMNGITGLISSIGQIAVGAATMGAGLPSIPYTTAESPRDVFGIPIPQTMHKSPLDVAKGNAGIAGGIASGINSITKIWGANASKYSPIHSLHNDSKAILNAQYGFIIYSSNNILNNYELTNAVKETGYQVQYITDNLDISDVSNFLDKTVLDATGTDITDYNIVKFEFVRITGLSTSLCNAIAQILMDGVKIWYTANV